MRGVRSHTITHTHTVQQWVTVAQVVTNSEDGSLKVQSSWEEEEEEWTHLSC